MHHENSKQVEALGSLIEEHSEGQLTGEQAAVAARVVASMFDLAGKGTLVAFKKWVLSLHAAGPYVGTKDDQNKKRNCAEEICC